MSASDAVLVGLVDGQRSLYVGPELDELQPADVLEGLVRRRLVGLGQPCPCGAVLIVPNRAQRRAARQQGVALQVPVEHEDDCPAVSTAVEAHLRGLR